MEGGWDLYTLAIQTHSVQLEQIVEKEFRRLSLPLYIIFLVKKKNHQNLSSHCELNLTRLC